MPGATRSGLSDVEHQEFEVTRKRQEEKSRTPIDDLLRRLSPAVRREVDAALALQLEERGRGLGTVPDCMTVGTTAEITRHFIRSELASAASCDESARTLCLDILGCLDAGVWGQRVPPPPEAFRRLSFFRYAEGRYRSRAEALEEYEKGRAEREAKELEERKRRNAPLASRISELEAKIAALEKQG